MLQILHEYTEYKIYIPRGKLGLGIMHFKSGEFIRNCNGYMIQKKVINRIYLVALYQINEY